MTTRELYSKAISQPDTDENAGSAFALFAQFDPRIDGLDADPGAVWAAADCPIRMVKVGPAATAWVIDAAGQESALVACTTPAQVNALYQGLAREPLVDFTPDHLLTPDVALDRFTDTAGDHLTRHGAGAGATIGRSPIFDNLSPAGYQANQLNAQASFYEAADATKYDVAGQAVVIGFVASVTQNGGGGTQIGKFNQAPGSNLGYAVTSNGGGGFGVLFNGSAGNVNLDTPFGAPTVEDGRLRLFHFGRSLLAGQYGYVRTPGIDPVVQAGVVGSLTNADGVFGLVARAGGAGLAQGTQQVQKIVRWLGAAAENVTLHMLAIESSLGAQLEGAAQGHSEFVPGLFSQFSRGMVGKVSIAHPVRALDATFAPAAASNRATLCFYSIKVESAGASIGHVELRQDGAAPPVTEICRTGGGTAVAILDTWVGVLPTLCLPGQNVRLVTVVDAGAPVFTLMAVTEFTL